MGGALPPRGATYYSPTHIETILRRARVSGIEKESTLRYMIMWFYGSIMVEGTPPLEGGILRLKYRADRRPGLPMESPFSFYKKYWSEVAAKSWGTARLWWSYRGLSKAIDAGARAATYPI
jgi:hypothetical protein